jgi:hypothetical protein
VNFDHQKINILIWVEYDFMPLKIQNKVFEFDFSDICFQIEPYIDSFIKLKWCLKLRISPLGNYVLF